MKLYKHKKAQLHSATGHKGIINNYMMMCVFILVAKITCWWVEAFFNKLCMMEYC